MENTDVAYTCVSCGRSEAEVPVLRWQFQGEQFTLCSSCLPILLHRPETLVGRLRGAEAIRPVQHAHD
jgi:hypothetical protein